MSHTTPLRERVLHLIREERTRQIRQYGTNETLAMGFGSTVTACPWLLPYSDDDSATIEARIREDYERYRADTGNPTWMHLIREEVAELFAAKGTRHVTAEAIQVAALCVSLVEHLETQGEDAWQR